MTIISANIKTSEKISSPVLPLANDVTDAIINIGNMIIAPSFLVLVSNNVLPPAL